MTLKVAVAPASTLQLRELPCNNLKTIRLKNRINDLGTGIFLTTVLLLTQMQLGYSQDSYRIRVLAFYNLENLFDTINDSSSLDDDRTPDGKDRWTGSRYRHKIAKLSQIVSEIGADISKTAPHLVGICEVENLRVLEDLTSHPNLSAFDYGIIHFDSPDERGIDVALLYKRTAFIPTSFKSHRLLIQDEQAVRDYTRDQLVVGGLLDQEEIHLIINHWPSRSGGEAKSKPYRIAAAQLNLRIMDSLNRLYPNAKIIGMGDLNDNPVDASLKKVLKTRASKSNLDPNDLFNPMETLFKKGAGSLAYRDQWYLFDQLYLSANFINASWESYTFWKAGIYNPSYLITQRGRYKGYPYRTYAGGRYIGGYSDHFPVYICLVNKER